MFPLFFLKYDENKNKGFANGRSCSWPAVEIFTAAEDMGTEGRVWQSLVYSHGMSPCCPLEEKWPCPIVRYLLFKMRLGTVRNRRLVMTFRTAQGSLHKHKTMAGYVLACPSTILKGVGNVSGNVLRIQGLHCMVSGIYQGIGMVSRNARYGFSGSKLWHTRAWMK